jgi:hypothetical protein
MATEKKAASEKKSISQAAKLFQSLFVAELDAEWVHPDVSQCETELEYLKQLINSPPEDVLPEELEVFKQEVQEDIKSLEARLEKLLKDIPLPREKFKLTKVTAEEFPIIEETVATAMAEYIAEEKQAVNRGRERRKMKLLLDSKGVFSDDVMGADGEGEDLAQARAEILELIVEQILQADGYSQEWATEIDEEDPDLELTEAEAKSLEISELLDPDQKAEAMLLRDEQKQKLLTEKRQRVIAERTQRREELKAKYKNKGFNALIDMLINYKILSEANKRSQALLQDLQLFYAVKKPEAPVYNTISGTKVLEGYERYFDSPEQLSFLRKQYPEFYAWLVYYYEQLQEIRTKEDAERVSRSPMFLPAL